MPSSALEQIAERIAGPEPLLLVNAPAGHGKTFQAVSAAEVMQPQLERGQKVLLLSHTNAAADEFARRSRAGGTIVETFDSFACQLVERYASYLGISLPLRPNALHLGQPSFEEIRRLACRLLREAPAIARVLAYQHPVILADEYQDSSRAHHELLDLIRSSDPVRVRYFGDGMQAIFDFDEELVDWEELTESHPTVSLTHGFRWDEVPEFRDWLAEARSQLKAVEPIVVEPGLTSVALQRWEGRAPGPGQRGNCPECFRLLRELRVQAEVAYLVRTHDQAQVIATRMPGLARIHEAGEVQEPLERLERARAMAEHPAELALLLIDTLRDWGVGIGLDLRRQLTEVCQDHEIKLGTKKRIRPLAEICEAIYSVPNERGFLTAFAAAVRRRNDLGWKPIRRELVYLLASVPPDADDPELALQALGQARRGNPGALSKLMTIHKAKGREIAQVVLPYVAENSFKQDRATARLLYVALTRARRDLQLLVPTENPSPWFVAR